MTEVLLSVALLGTLALHFRAADRWAAERARLTAAALARTPEAAQVAVTPRPERTAPRAPTVPPIGL